MNYKMMGRFLSMMVAVEGAFMLPALLFALADGKRETILAFLLSIGICAVIALVLFLLCRTPARDFFAKEGMLCVGISWVVLSFLGALPFCLSGEIPSYLDALFEIVSGFSTTGATVVADVEALSQSILYWRSFSHWLGGMGVLVFLLAIVPVSGRSQGFTMHLLRAESPGPDVGKLVPKMRRTATILYTTYIVLTVLNFLFLIIGGMPLFDALCTVFGTAGTGGFSVKNNSMAGYSPYLQNVTTVFMLLFGVNFSCYYLLTIKDIRGFLRDEELRLYFGIVLVSSAVIAVAVRPLYAGLGDTLRHSFFEVASIITTTGFTTTDINAWPAIAKAVLLILMVIGACAGSTGGGFKVARLLIILKSVRRSIGEVIHPHKISSVQVSRKPVSEKVIDNTKSYLCAYILIVFGSFLLVSLDGLSLECNISAVISCFNNIGPGFGECAPNFTCFGPLSKIVLIFDMLAGRLEVFPILVLFSPRVLFRRG